MGTDLERILLREIAPASVVVDVAGLVLLVSGPIGRYLEAQGAPPVGVLGLARDEVRAPLHAALRRAAREETPVVERGERRPGAGPDEVTEVVVRPLPPTDAPARFLVTFREVGAERGPEREEVAAAAAVAAVTASRRSEARLEQIVDTLPHLVWTTTADGIRDHFSRQWREYTGLAEGPQLEAGWIDAYHPADRDAMLAAWAASVRTGAPFEAEYRIRRHDGVYRWFKGRANPLRDARGVVERWIGTSTDVDDVKRLEASLREGSRRKDEFMALLAHELRNPLAPLGNAVDLLRHHPDRAVGARAVETIDRQVSHLARLVDDLLDVSRITRGKIRIRREQVDLAALLANLLEDHRPLFAAAGLRLDGELSGGPLWIQGDPARVAQMVDNLLQNARKFTDRGGTVTLAAAPAPDGGSVVVRVRDTGVGIDPASVDRMFDAFAQGDATLAHSQGGLGLGLTLVRALAELHGGSVSGASEGPGRGAEFVLRLPLAAAPAEASAARARAAGAPRRRVLVVDDNGDAADTFAELLRLRGHDVRVAADGAAALEEARRFLPEVAFCDIGLPGALDGYALGRALRAEPGLGGALLVAMTGYATEDDRRRAREAGFDLHLSKPTRIDVIAGVLARWTPADERRDAATDGPEPAATG
jgi:PAS domain S-box-containing protein